MTDDRPMTIGALRESGYRSRTVKDELRSNLMVALSRKKPLFEGIERIVATGDRAAELALRARYAGIDPSAIEVEPNLEHALDRGLALTAAGGELVVLPTYTAMLALRKVAVERGLVRPYWERVA
jgi:hypothetical protein